MTTLTFDPAASLLARPQAFERGDHVYLTTPLTLATPSAGDIEEYAFASAVKSQAPNEHIGWLSGRYVEAGRANLNGAMWLNDELALKALTPMLMPVTVMHDPRTAVGTIADCKLIAEGSSRIDTILAVWKHRFGDIWAEAEHNIQEGTMMQSMECLSPSYCCSECGQQYVKLAEGKEQASWCTHLRENSSWRILENVCFTGTGLIFGTRGGQGAYTEAHLGTFQDEVAEYHAKSHIDGTYRPSEGSKTNMGLVQIDETELANLRRERDEAKSVASTAEANVATVTRDLTTKVETAEAAAQTAKTEAETAKSEKAALEEKAQAAELRDKRLAPLGVDFLASLGEFTRERLAESASTLSDEAWEAELKEKEELSKTERAAGGPTTGGTGTTTDGPKKTPMKPKPSPDLGESAFNNEELAAFAQRSAGTTTTETAPVSGNPARALARSFGRKPVKTSA